MSPTPWKNWEWEQNCSYSRNGKRRLDEVNNTIDCLKKELMMNDIVLKNELDVRIYSKFDRELLAAELYKERLEALANSSRTQIWRVQTGNSPLPAHDFHLDYDSWNPKRMKYSYVEGYPQNSNTYYQDWAVNTIQKNKYIPPTKRAPPVKPATSKVASVPLSKKSKAISKPIKHNNAYKTIKPGKSNSVAAIKKIVPSKTSIPVTVTQTATKKAEQSKSSASVAKTTSNTLAVKANNSIAKVGVATNKNQACVNAAKVVTPSTSNSGLPTVKTEPVENIPSLFSCDLSAIKFQFPEIDGFIFKNEKNLKVPFKNTISTVNIKTEPAIDEYAMVDDLADHL